MISTRPAGRYNGLASARWRLAAGMVIMATVVLLARPAMSEELVLELAGSASGLTDEFEIEGPWLLDWHVGTDFPGSFGIEIDLVDSMMLSHEGKVLKTRYAGAGTRLFNNSGIFRFRVTSSLARWRLRILKITDDEAAAMEPRR